MSSDDDEPPSVVYEHANDNLLTSAADKQRKALNHFDYFLKDYCKQISIQEVKHNDIPFQGTPSGKSDQYIFKIWDDVMGAFATYMGKHARGGFNPKGQRLSKSTAVGVPL